MSNVLIFGATSDIAQETLKLFLKNSDKVFAVSRNKLNLVDNNLAAYNCDLSVSSEINKLFLTFKDLKFDYILNFQGCAISSPVEFLPEDELKYQLSISLFSLLAVLQNLRGHLNDNSRILIVSSMASYGIFPFLSPYAISKASSDLLLSNYEMETGVKTISIKLGVVGTKFWERCVKRNEDNFKNFSDEYGIIGKFLKANALNNSNKGLKPEFAGKKIYQIIKKKNPKVSYNLGRDSYFSMFVSYFKSRFVYNVIRNVLRKRIKVSEL